MFKKLLNYFGSIAAICLIAISNIAVSTSTYILFNELEIPTELYRKP